MWHRAEWLAGLFNCNQVFLFSDCGGFQVISLACVDGFMSSYWGFLSCIYLNIGSIFWSWIFIISSLISDFSTVHLSFLGISSEWNSLDDVQSDSFCWAYSWCTELWFSHSTHQLLPSEQLVDLDLLCMYYISTVSAVFKMLKITKSVTKNFLMFSPKP